MPEGTGKDTMTDAAILIRDARLLGEQTVDVLVREGRIAELGSHAELIARGGLYARLWQHQTGGFVGVE